MRFGDSNLWGCVTSFVGMLPQTLYRLWQYFYYFLSWILTRNNTHPCSHSIPFGKEQGRLDQLLGTQTLIFQIRETGFFSHRYYWKQGILIPFQLEHSLVYKISQNKSLASIGGGVYMR
jgi:hypothetical protein